MGGDLADLLPDGCRQVRTRDLALLVRDHSLLVCDGPLFSDSAARPTQPPRQNGDDDNERRQSQQGENDDGLLHVNETYREWNERGACWFTRTAG